MSETITGALSTAFSGVQSDVISIISVALPAALAIVGITIAIRIGIKFFKGVSKG